MGVKHLWDIIDETKSKETLDTLHGKVLSVDLSIWIVEALKTLQLQRSVKKPYLRNIFFRILCLRRLGIKLIFVTEGEPPDLKQQTMKQRMKQQHFVDDNPKKKWGRSRFQRIINECCCLLDMLGIPHVKAVGEAEAMCAVLNKHKLTDGCLTNDGDFFLYGGEVVYRDFGIDPKDPHVLIYTAQKIKERLKISHKDMVGLSLLCGCDYTKGVSGVGKILVSKFLKERNFDEDLLCRFRKWHDVGFVTSDNVSHTELLVARKAIKEPHFMNQKVVNEFLINKDSVTGLSGKFTWRYPNIKGTQEFMFSKLEWPLDYTLKKVLQLCTCTYLEKLSEKCSTPAPLVPTKILKTSCQAGTALLEIEWIQVEDKRTANDEQWSDVPANFTTLENQQIVCKVLPDFVEKFLTEKEEKRKGKTKSKKKRDKPLDPKSESVVNELCEQFRQISTTPTTSKCKAVDVNTREDVNIGSTASSTKDLTAVSEDCEIVDDCDVSLNEDILPLSQRILRNVTNKKIIRDKHFLNMDPNTDVGKSNEVTENRSNEDCKNNGISPTRRLQGKFCNDTPKCSNIATPELVKIGKISGITSDENSSPSNFFLGDSLLCESLDDISVLL